MLPRTLLHPRARVFVLLLVACAAPRPACAWSVPMHEAIAEQAARLMPVSLQVILGRHLGELRRGSVAPLTLAGSPALYLHEDGSFGTLDEATLRQSQRILDLIARQEALPNVAYEMGVLSHLVALAENPTHCSSGDPHEAEWAPDFQRFTEQRIPRFIVVFDGYRSEALERDDVRGFVRWLCERSRRHYPILTSSYVQPDGHVVSGSSFDDRHPVFGVASLAYTHAISDTAKIWLYLWIRSDGDTAGIPFPQAFAALRPDTGTRAGDAGARVEDAP